MCFIIMPFAPEFYYFYLYLKRHIEEYHQIRCERADERFGTKPFLEKINYYIKEVEVIIADCSGANANVFYELGLAHASKKEVILITRDEVQNIPADIRHFDFIRYQLGTHIEFEKKLDQTLNEILSKKYESLYQSAQREIKEFKQSTKLQIELVSKEEFLNRVKLADSTKGLPSKDNAPGVAAFVIPKILTKKSHNTVKSQISDWLSKKYKPSKTRKPRQKKL